VLAASSVSSRHAARPSSLSSAAPNRSTTASASRCLSPVPQAARQASARIAAAERERGIADFVPPAADAPPDDRFLRISGSNDDKGAADDLYALPLGEFTPARDELARRLRKGGRREEADAVKRLRKPTTAAWALNQLARRRREDVARLLEAGERLRRAQAELLGGGGRAELDTAAAQERELVGALAGDAAAIAAEAGVGSSAALVEKLRATLHAAAADEEVAGELAAGRLLREREAVGVLGITAAAAPPVRAERPRKAARRPAREVRELERRLKAARAGEREVRRRREIAERATARARERAAEAAERLDAARRDEEEAATVLEAAEAQVRDLERELDQVREGG
jgi:hypothetical protein